MKAVVVERTGGPESLALRDVATPEPGPGQALVRLEAAGINFIDTYLRSGVYPAPHLPFVNGQEGAGTVEAVGPEVTEFAAGDRVAYAGALGAYAEFAAVPVAQLVRVPDGVSAREAAAVMLQGMTAHYLVNSTYPLQEGETALIHAGAGGVGLLLTQLAKAKGARAITTVSSAEKSELSRAAGADATIEYTREDFAARTREFTGGLGAHVVYDSVGKTTWEKSLDSLRKRGYFVLFGGSSGQVPPFDLQVLNAKGSLFVTRPKLGDYVATPEELQWRAGELFAMVRDEKLRLRIEHTYPLAEARRAHEDLEGRKTTGKLLLIP